MDCFIKSKPKAGLRADTRLYLQGAGQVGEGYGKNAEPKVNVSQIIGARKS